MQVKQPNFMRLGARQHPKDVLFIQVLLGHLPAGRYNHPNKKPEKTEFSDSMQQHTVYM